MTKRKVKMPVEIESAPGPLDEVALARFEKALGSTLPADYRHFLLEYNGGSPRPGTFAFVERGRRTESVVQFFLVVGPHKHYGFDKTLRNLRAEGFPSDLLPIAEDPGGNFVCMALKGPDRGKLYFWDHEDPADDASRMPLVAESFTAFLAGLCD
jgi:hypothetical protein